MRRTQGSGAEQRGRAGHSSSERVYQALKAEILSERRPPGSWLVETELAADFHVSRTPVREALKRLTVEGLVAHDPYRGTIVRAIDVLEAVEICEIHEVHDGLAARLAAQRASAGSLARLAWLLDVMRDHLCRGALESLVEANAEFHDLLYELAGNERLTSMARGLADSLRRFSRGALTDRERAAEVLREHERIVRALESRDPAAAEFAARAHGRACMSWTHAWLASQRLPKAGEG
jgi:DNA-binding GntR family transcriptional regulator